MRSLSVGSRKINAKVNMIEFTSDPSYRIFMSERDAFKKKSRKIKIKIAKNINKAK